MVKKRGKENGDKGGGQVHKWIMKRHDWISFASTLQKNK